MLTSENYLNRFSFLWSKVLVRLSLDIVCEGCMLTLRWNKKITVVCSFPSSLWLLSALTCLLAVSWEG